MTHCLKCNDGKYSHWSNGIIGACTLPGCKCTKYVGRICARSIRAQLEKKYNIIRKDKIRVTKEDNPWC